jgi:integrase
MTALKYRVKVKDKWEYATPVKWYFHFRVNGKRIKSRPLYSSKREALTAEKIERDRYSEHVEKKYSEVYKELSESYAANVSLRGKQEYDSVYKNHISKFLPDHYVNRYVRSDIEKFKVDLARNGRSNNTINKAVKNVNRTMRFACRQSYTGTNPFEYTPKLKHIKKEKEFFNYEEYLQFIDAVDIPMYHLIFELFYWTGLRKGELLVLQWKDIDFNTGMMKISKHFSYQQAGKYLVLPGRKNGASYSVELHEELLQHLADWKAYKSNTDGFREDFYLFGDYRPLAPEDIRRQLNKAIRKAGVKKVDIHSFRHSHVSYLYNYCPDLTIQDIAYRIGDTVQVVLKTYSHIFANKYGKYSDAIKKSLVQIDMHDPDGSHKD